MPRVKARAVRDEVREGTIHQALEERARLNTSFEDLHHKYGIPRSTLCDRAGGVESREKSHKDYQALTPAMEDAMVKWALRMDSQGFPPRLDLFKATAEKLFHDTNASEPNATPQVCNGGSNSGRRSRSYWITNRSFWDSLLIFF